MQDHHGDAQLDTDRGSSGLRREGGGEQIGSIHLDQRLEEIKESVPTGKYAQPNDVFAPIYVTLHTNTTATVNTSDILVAAEGRGWLAVVQISPKRALLAR